MPKLIASYLIFASLSFTAASCDEAKTNITVDSGTQDTVVQDTATDTRTTDVVNDVSVDVARDTVVDAVLDTAVDVATDATTDATSLFRALAPCNTESAYTSVGTAVSIVGFGYSPACLRVTAGARVSIEAETFHPLAASTLGTSPSPIPSNAPATATYSFPNPGFYPYYCSNHGTNAGDGMAGVIWVQ